LSSSADGTQPGYRARVELVDLPDFGPDDVALVVDGEVDPYATAHLPIEWRQKSSHVGLVDEGHLIATAGWVPARVRTGSGPVDVLGLGGVMVHRQRRGHGVGAVLVAGTMRRMAESGGALGMLFCRPVRLAFYQRLGWHRIDAEVTADQPGGPVIMPLLTCWTPLAPGATMPLGELHVEGLPF
jgi:GNAT superfamily N-acetyltransferase